MAKPQPLPTGIQTGPLAAYGGYVYTIGSDNNLYKLSTTVAIPDGTAVPILDVSAAVGIQYITINFNIDGLSKNIFDEVALFKNYIFTLKNSDIYLLGKSNNL
jgi:hypothetical protein